MLEPKTPSDGGSTGFKGFNNTGRDDTARVVLRPQVDPASRQRAAMLIAVAVVLIGIVGYVAFSRSHLSLIPTDQENNRSFAPGERSVDRAPE